MDNRLKKIRLLILDVDGTMTDGAMYYSAEGDIMKRFYVQDGMGITLLQRAGIDVALLTSENSPIVLARAKKLGIRNAILGCRAKKQAVEDLAKSLQLNLDEIAYMGDDVNDEAPMKIVGAAACPADAVYVIRSVSHYVCACRGGHGALREFAEMLLKSQDKPNTLPHAW